MRHRFIYILTGLLLMVICTSCGNTLDDLTEQDPMEVILSTGIGEVAGESRGTGIMTNALTADLPVSFIRLDKEPGYPADYSGIGYLPATIDKDTKVVSFATRQYYNSNGNNSKFVAWYPSVQASSGASTWNAASGQVTFPVLDGTTDILLSETIEGSKLSQITGTRKIEFKHALTQVRVYVYATSTLAVSSWGKVQSINFVGKKQTCVATLPVTTADVPALPSTSFSGTDDLPASTWNNSAFTDVTLGTTEPVTQGDTPDAPHAYAMFAPHKNTTDKLTISFKTENGGTQTITFDYAKLPLEAGKSYIVKLKFMVGDIEPTATIADWTPADDEVSEFV